MPERVSGTQNSFRADVEGLRGFAIALVVIGHVWWGKVTGGVDVFLMISGFFLIPSLLKSGVNPSMGFVSTAYSRLKRIIGKLWSPMALAAVVTGAGVIAVLPTDRFREVLTQMTSALAWTVNWTLGLTQDGGYGTVSSGVSPYQHLWSMAVQAQIFIFLILTVLALVIGVRKFTGSPSEARVAGMAYIIALTVSSFIYATTLHQSNQVLNYYNTFSRLWEILLGGLVGLLASTALAGMVSGMWAEVLSWVGIAAIVATGFFIDGVQAFPGYLGLVPLLGASAVMVGGMVYRTSVAALLETRVLRYIGSHAFHIYLWHWPILVLYVDHQESVNPNRPEGHVSIIEGLAIIGVSIIIAELASRFFALQFSTPTYSKIYTGAKYVLPVAVVGVLAAVAIPMTRVSAFGPEEAYAGAQVMAEPDKASHLPKVPLRPRTGDAVTDFAVTLKRGCFIDNDRDGFQECVVGDPHGQRHIVVAGGSHAEHLIPAIDQIAKKHHIKVTTFFKAQCPIALKDDGTPETRFAIEKNPQWCGNWMEKTLHRIEQIKPEFVITNSTRPNTDEGKGDYTPAEYVNGFRWLIDRGINVIGVRDSPWVVKENGRTPPQCLSAGNDEKTCGVEKAVALSPKDPAVAAMAELDQSRLSLFDWTGMFCNETTCPAVIGNVIVYRDRDHLTASYVRTMTPYIENELADRTAMLD